MRKSDFDFANDIKKAAEQKGSGSAWLLLLLIVALISSTIYWASVWTIEQGAAGIGRVIPSRQTQLVENLDAGIVREILIREGDLVEEGQVLIKLENTGENARLSELLKRELELSIELDRLELEINGQPVFSPPQDADRYPEKMIKDQETIFVANLRRLEENLRIRQFQKSQKEQALNEARANIKKQELALELVSRELKLSADLFKKKAIPELEYIRARRAAQELESNLEIATASTARIKAEINEAKAQIEAENSNYKIAALERYTLVNSDLTAVVERIKEAKEKVRQSDLTSPVSGIINQLNVTTEGDVLLPGTTAVEITPVDDQLLFEVDIRPQDIAFVRPGLRAQIRLSAYDYTKYGAFEGTVERIGSDTIVNENNDSFFRVIVTTDGVNAFPDEVQVIPGMIATVNILTGERTVLDLVLRPVLRVRDLAFRN